MFDHLVKANGLEQVMEQHGLELPQDLDFIKEQIAGPLNNGPSQRHKVPVAVHVVDRRYFYIVPLSCLTHRCFLKGRSSNKKN